MTGHMEIEQRPRLPKFMGRCVLSFKEDNVVTIFVKKLIPNLHLVDMAYLTSNFRDFDDDQIS